MAMGRAMGSVQPNHQTAGPSGLGDPSRTVLDEVLELWASLPRRFSRRRYFRDQEACCSRALFSDLLSTINACVRNIERALAEFIHATATSILVPPAQSGMKRTCEDAGSPSSPAPTSTSKGINFDIS